ncbi:MAG: GerW family sporulation protein [Vicinamibacterales bacterium]
MEQVESLLKTTLGEIERLLNTKSVVGEPITVDGNTVIPLVSIGFGFGAGGGTGKDPKNPQSEGAGQGSGGGGGVKPVAVVIVNKDGVRVETVRGTASVVEKLGEAVSKVVEKRATAKA